MGDDAAAADDVDPDAPWRPGRTRPSERVEPTVLTAPRSPPRRRRLARASPETTDRAPSPWSRAGAETTAEPVMRWRPDEVAAAARQARRERLEAGASPAGRPVATVDGAPPSSVTGEVVLAGLVVVAAVLVAVLVAIALPADPSGPAPPPDAAVLPTAVGELWSAEIDGGVERLAIGPDVVVVASPDGLTAFDTRSGAERWRHAEDAVGSTDLAVVGGRVVAIGTGPGRAPTVAVFDAATGDLRWRRRGSADVAFVRLGGSLYELASEGSGRRVRLRLLDADTVQPLGSIVVDEVVTATPPYLAAADGDRVRMVDADTLVQVAPAVPKFELRSVALVGDRVVGFDEEARIVVFDAAGRRSDQRPFVSDAFGEFTGRAELVGGIPDHDVGVVASGSSLGFRIVDDRIEVVWTLPGRVGPAVPTERGPISVARIVDATGEINFALVDPIGGDVVAVTDAGTTREADPVIGWNGYLVAPEIGASERVLRALDHGGEQLWQLPLPPGASYDAAHEVLVVVTRGLDTARLTVHG